MLISLITTSCQTGVSPQDVAKLLEVRSTVLLMDLMVSGARSGPYYTADQVKAILEKQREYDQQLLRSVAGTSRTSFSIENFRVPTESLASTTSREYLHDHDNNGISRLRENHHFLKKYDIAKESSANERQVAIDTSGAKEGTCHNPSSATDATKLLNNPAEENLEVDGDATEITGSMTNTTLPPLNNRKSPVKKVVSTESDYRHENQGRTCIDSAPSPAVEFYYIEC